MYSSKLVFYCTGVIFISFLAVYLLFNVLVRSYIRDMAQRELSDGVQMATYMAYFVPAEMRNPFFVQLREDTSWTVEDIEPEDEIIISFAPYAEGAIGFRWHVDSHDFSYVTVHAAMNDGITPLDRVIHVTDTMMLDDFELVAEMGITPLHVHQINAAAMETRLAHGQVRVSHHGTPSLMNTNVIMMNGYNEIVSPNPFTLNYEGRAEIAFLVDHYLTNQGAFARNGMTMVSGTTSTYYMRTLSRNIQDGHGPVSILLYTDISSAVDFQNRMNRILGVLLVLTGLFSFVIYTAMSTKFKKAIGRLCRYADAIGRGSWSERPGGFSDVEFNRLSESMDSMSNMLQAFESSQKQFFQNVSHELRTPLMSIQGYAEGLLADIFCKDEAASIILAEGQKMGELVGDLLYISKIDSVEQSPESMTCINLTNLLCECIERVKPIAQKAGKQVTIFPPAYGINLFTDENRLERAITNILSNAIRHAKSVVEVCYAEADDMLEIEIWDDGNGIDPADLPNIFKRFYKGENGNHGLGLAISKDIVKSLNGEIMAGNAGESGAVFTIVLPQALK